MAVELVPAELAPDPIAVWLSWVATDVVASAPMYVDDEPDVCTCPARYPTATHDAFVEAFKASKPTAVAFELPAPASAPEPIPVLLPPVVSLPASWPT